MIDLGKSSKPLRSFFIGLLAFGAIFLAAIQLPNIAKTLGTPFMLWPEFLGVTQRVRTDEIVTVTLGARAVESSAEIPQTGNYLLYTDNYELLNNAVQSGSISWMKLFSVASADRIPLTSVDRGLRPYDTPLARGRPILRFELPRSGSFNFEHPSQGEPVNIYLVPDYLTGREATLSILFLFQLALVIAIPLTIHYYATCDARQEREAQRASSRAKTDAFFENERKKRSAGLGK